MSADPRIVAVERLLAAARMIRARGATEALVASTGLSTEGVALALERCLETSAEPAELAAFVARAIPAPAVAVVLASNVFVGALRAIAFARASAPRVIVRPSHRDPELARLLVATAGDPGITLDESFDVAELAEGEVHVYGRDQTIAALKAKARAGVIMRGHGSGMGIAWVSGADLEGAARSIADDVVVLDQRGCLSPRVVLVAGARSRGEAFVRSLHEALGLLGRRVPRGALSAEETAASRRYTDTLIVSGDALVGDAHVVGLGPRGAPLVLPPTHRHVHVACVADVREAEPLVAPWRAAITIVGTDDPTVAARLAPRARLAKLGAMQTPPFDGPVDLR